MAKYICPESMDGGPAYIQANCNLLAVVMAFTVGQSYDAVMGAGNVLATADMAPGDFSFANGGVANERVMNNASKGATASGTGTPTHFVFVNTGASKILRVTEENTGAAVTTGNSVTFPNLPLTSRQPVAV